MSSVLSGRASYRWFTILLLVAAGFYAWYVIAQYDRLNDLNQRQLANAAADLTSTFENAMETVRQFDEKSKNVKGRPSEATNGHADRPLSLCDFDAGQPYLELAGCTRRDSPPPSWAPNADIKPVANPTLGIKWGDFKSAHPRTDPLLFQFHSDILFKELASVDTFELIFVASSEGHVLAQDAPAGRRWIRYLRWAEQMSRDARAQRSPAIRIEDLKQVVGGTGETWNQIRAVSSRTGVKLAGTGHQLYLQPVRLKSPTSDDCVDIIVGGVVPTNWIVRDALAVDADLLGFLVFLVLLGLLGFPFVKLAVLHRRERFRLRDVALLHLSTGALLVLLTCAAFALDGYRRWQAEADDGLKDWADYLEARLLGELNDIRDRLVKYDTLLKSNLRDQRACGTVQTDWFLGKPELTTGPVGPLWPLKPPGSVYLRQVGWIRSDGQQKWKTTADGVRGLIRVDQRPYVVAVQNNRLYQIATTHRGASALGEQRPFFFGPDRSISDGRFYTFVSIPSETPSSTCPDPGKKSADRAASKLLSPPSVVAASGVLLSLDRQPMPAGYGFALVNREGQVLYHSDRRLSLRENLFEELSQSARVRAKIYTGDDDSVSTRYRERAHDFFLKPISDLTRAGEHEPAGFYIVTFRDISIERAIVGHEFVAGLVGPMLVLFALWVVGMSALALIARFILKDRWGTWLWPHGGLEHVYKRQAIVFGAVLLLTLILCVRGYPIAAAVAPLFTAVFGVAIYVHGQKDNRARRRLQRVGWHTAALLLLIVCLVVLPSAVLFRLALHREFGKLIQTESIWIAAQRADAPRDAEDDVPHGRYGDDLRCAHRAARRALYSRRAIPTPFVFPPAGTPSAGVEPTLLRVADSGPDVSGAGADSITPDCPKTPVGSTFVGTAGFTSPAGNDQLSPTDFRLVKYLDLIDDMLPIENDAASRAHFDLSWSTHSPAGTVVPSIPISGLALVSLALMLSVVAWWIRWNANWLFFANYEPKSSPALPSAPFNKTLKRCTAEEQIVLLQISRERIANPANRRVVEKLLNAGLVRLCPDLRAWPPEFEEFLLTTEKDRHAEVAKSERVTDEHSWHSVRLLLTMGVTGLTFFLVVTQPALQSAMLGIASGVTTALTTGLQLRNAITSWLPGRKAGA